MAPLKNAITAIISFSIVALLLSGCVGGKSGSGSSQSAAPQKQESQQQSESDKLELTTLEEVKTNESLAIQFDNVVIGSLSSSEQILKDYPDAGEDCLKQVVKHLKSKKSYKKVTTNRAQKHPGASAIVDFEITDMRIASSTARMWGGAFVGSSFMNVKVVVRQAGQKKILHQKLLGTTNSAWGASFSGGSSDRSLPSDFGVLIGEYLSQVIPAK